MTWLVSSYFDLTMTGATWEKEILTISGTDDHSMREVHDFTYLLYTLITRNMYTD